MSVHAAAIGVEKPCTLWVHSDSYSSDDVLFNPSAFPDADFCDGLLLKLFAADSGIGVRDFGSTNKSRDGGHANPRSLNEHINHSQVPSDDFSKSRPSGVDAFVFVAHDATTDSRIKGSNLQLSVHESIAKLYGFRHRMSVILAVADQTSYEASHVELAYRDPLDRADLWKLTVAKLRNNKCLYRGQNFIFMGIMKITVRKIYINGRKLSSAVFTDHTKPIFRSESTRFLLAVQMSKEMWDFDVNDSGEILWSRAINFVEQLFKRWQKNNARHLVTVILFTRLESIRSSTQNEAVISEGAENIVEIRDFYRVVASDVASIDTINLLRRFKAEFHSFLEDVQFRPKSESSTSTPVSSPAIAFDGNLLEVINLAASCFAQDKVDPDFARTGMSLIIVTPGTAIHKVNERTLRLTTDRIVNSGISVDLVSLADVPLHTIPLFVLSDPAAYTRCASEKTPLESESGSNVIKTPTNQTNLHRWDGLVDAKFAVPVWIEVSFFAHPGSNYSNAVQNSRRKRCKMLVLQTTGLTGRQIFPRIDALSPDSYQTAGDETPICEKSLISYPSMSASSLSYSSNSNSRIPGSMETLSKLNRSHENGSMSNNRKQFDWTDDYDADVFVKPTISKLTLSAYKTPKKTKEIRSDSLKSHIDPVPDKQIYRAPSEAPSVIAHSTPSQLGKDVLRPFSSIGKLQSISSSKPRSSLASIFRGSSGLGKATATTSSTLEFAKSSLELSKVSGEIKAHGSKTISSHFRQSLSRNLTPSRPSTTELRSKPIIIDSPTLTAKDDGLNTDMEFDNRSDVLSTEDALGVASTSYYAPLLQTNHSEIPERLNKEETFQPWLTILNPSQSTTVDGNNFGIWMHIYAQRSRPSAVKWRSICSPASLPLTTETYPSLHHLLSEFVETPYKLSLVESEQISGANARGFLARDIIQSRLSHGFQIAVGKRTSEITHRPASDAIALFANDFMGEDGSSVLMLKGEDVHLLCTTSNNVAITRYQRKLSRVQGQLYNAKICTERDNEYRECQFDFPAAVEKNWNNIDNHLSHQRSEFMKSSPTSAFTINNTKRARFVLLPIEISKNLRHSVTISEDSDEEIRIEGIRNLTLLWQKNRFSVPADHRFSASWIGHKDPNPLNIEYQTHDPSLVVATGLETSPIVEGQATVYSTQLFNESDLYRTSDVDLRKLAIHLQSEKGIKMRDRRWHFKVHHFCFEGSEMNSFLLANFQDLSSRDDAINFGNILMQKGLFRHVYEKHHFRDGNFFYTLSTEYRIKTLETKTTWFGSRKPEKQHTNPMSESMIDIQSPGLLSPRIEKGTKKPTVTLSAAIQYDIDPRKRSHKPEIVTIHYDRLHNPENSFHIQLEWSSTTERLIEESIVSWAIASEKYGLKLVQIPVAELSEIRNSNPFRSPVPVMLAVAPPQPDQHPDDSATSLPSSPSLEPQRPVDPYRFHKAILKRYDFVLDYEAASAFPVDVDIVYSSGNPSFTYPQYIHRSGLLLAQIHNDGHFLILANRLCSHRAAVPKDFHNKFDNHTRHTATSVLPSRQSSATLKGLSPFTSPLMRASDLKTEPLASNLDSPKISAELTRLEKFSSSRSQPDNDTTRDEVRLTPRSRNQREMLSAEGLGEDFAAFCSNAAELQALYDELAPELTPIGQESAKATPAMSAVSAISAMSEQTRDHVRREMERIPPLELARKESKDSVVLREERRSVEDPVVTEAPAVVKEAQPLQDQTIEESKGASSDNSSELRPSS